MLLSTQTEHLANAFGYEEAIRILYGACYDAFDFSQFGPLSETDPLYGKGYREYAASLRDKATSLGIICNQSHAPFPSSKGDPEKDTAIFEDIVRSVEIASILGAKCIVVHPMQHLPYRENAALLKKMNLEFYRRLSERCAGFPIRIATENMWHMNPVGGKTIVDSVCSRAEEFCEYIDMLEPEGIVACLDIGHISLVGEDVSHMIRTLGSRIKALHVHDTDGYRDLHTLPFTSKNDFPAIMKLLNEIGYEGDLTFEADNFFANFPTEMYHEVACFMQVTGRMLMKIGGFSRTK